MPNMTAPQSHLDRFDLVTGSGDRQDSELCVMSLVALMSGDRHTDRPATACPVIAAFVIKINDAIDCDTRQDLKPLAYRILGTNDGLGRDRAWLLARECVNDVFARILENLGAPGNVVANLPRMPLRVNTDFDIKGLSRELQGVGRSYGVERSRLFDLRYLLRALHSGHDELVASAAAVMMVDSARLIDAPVAQNIYWNKAVDMFSQLCDIGESAQSSPHVIEERLMAEANRDRAIGAYGPILLWLFPGLRKPQKTA